MTAFTIFTSVIVAPPTANSASVSSSSSTITPTHTVTQTVTATRKATPTTSIKQKIGGVSFTQNTIDVNSGAVYTWVQAPIEGSRKRKRHSKRHSNWSSDMSKDLPWVNPCGGFYVPSAAHGGSAMRRKNPRQIFNMLKKSAGNEYKMLVAGHQDIDISNIHMWSLHNKTYKFLPKLKVNSTIALKRWYRNMQSFVGSFAYLRRVQRAWDMAKLQHENSTARELQRLVTSARNMLCELETAINGTMPAPRMLRGNTLPQVTSAQMNKRLKLYTKRRVESYPNAVQEANTIDLMWVKYYYYEFLHQMWTVLRQQTKRRGQVALLANPKAFNEVEKHFGSLAATKHELSKNKQRKSQTIEEVVSSRSSSSSGSRSNSDSNSSSGNSRKTNRRKNATVSSWAGSRRRQALRLPKT